MRAKIHINLISEMCIKHSLKNNLANYTKSDILTQRLDWPAFLKLFQILRRRTYHSDNFFPAEYEYLYHFFLARPDLPNFYVKCLKITLNGSFFSVIAEDN